MLLSPSSKHPPGLIGVIASVTQLDRLHLSLVPHRGCHYVHQVHHLSEEDQVCVLLVVGRIPKIWVIRVSINSKTMDKYMGWILSKMNFRRFFIFLPIFAPALFQLGKNEEKLCSTFETIYWYDFCNQFSGTWHVPSHDYHVLPTAQWWTG